LNGKTDIFLKERVKIRHRQIFERGGRTSYLVVFTWHGKGQDCLAVLGAKGRGAASHQPCGNPCHCGERQGHSHAARCVENE